MALLIIGFWSTKGSSSNPNDMVIMLALHSFQAHCIASSIVSLTPNIHGII